MVEFKAIVNDVKTGKSYNVAVSGHHANSLIGINIGEVVDGIFVGLPGYKLKITGGSDGNGTPMRRDLPGNKRVKLLLSDSLGFHEKYPGQRKRVAIRGSAISAEIVQINMAVAEYGPKSIEEPDQHGRCRVRTQVHRGVPQPPARGRGRGELMKVPQQPEINIGMIGHVDHGKTTLTKALSGEWTDRHSEELKRGISIRLGYADVAFYKCPQCQGPAAYGTTKKCKNCGADTEFLRAVSFVDAPGHETLMATMLSGAALMDGALLLVAANEKCPQPQTKEHLMALSIIGIDKIIIVQNKIDIVSREQAVENYRQIKEFVKGTIAENAPIIPISANRGVNIDMLIEAIEEHIVSKVVRDTDAPPLMHVARSFDINSPGTKPEDLKGGVLGGSLMQGTLSVGDEIEIAPGRKTEVAGKTVYERITAKITSLEAGGRSVDKVLPGGLIAIGTGLDASITKSDGLTGRVIGRPGELPRVAHDFSMKTVLLDRVVGSSAELSVDEIKSNEPLMLSVGTATTVGVVKSARSDSAEVALKIPVCILPGQRVAISRRISNKWRLIGYGIVE